MNKDIKKNAPKWGDKEMLSALLTQPLDNLVRPVAHRGDSAKDFGYALRDIHLMVRKHYSELIHNVGRNTYPLIIASDNESIYQGVGGSYTLYLENGVSERVVPTSPEYEIHKNLSHIPLGLFSIISPYFNNTFSTNWRGEMKNFHRKIKETKNMITVINSKDNIFYHGKLMLSLADRYIKKCLHKNRINIDTYMEFTENYLEYIELSIQAAAKLQVNDVRPKLLAWKNMLGEKWHNLYVIIPTVWPVSGNNPRKQIFESLMDSDKAKTNIIMTENVKTIDDALTVLGRVVTDRAAARLIFGAKSKNARSLTCALSTPRDLISDACEKSIGDLNLHSCKERA